jgi:hypothetical protein
MAPALWIMEIKNMHLPKKKDSDGEPEIPIEEALL